MNDKLIVESAEEAEPFKLFELGAGMHKGISNEDYHRDRTCISKTWLDKVAVSPLHLQQYLNLPHEQTLALTIGSAVDALVFEPDTFDKLFVVGPKDDKGAWHKKTTKAGKEAWANAYAEAEKDGRIIIECHLTDHLTAIQQMADAIKGNGLMREILQDGAGQVTFVAQDEVTGLWRKCKTDHYHEATNGIFDLKTAVSASPYEFARSIAKYRYHVQDAYYSDIVEMVVGSVPSFGFAVMEKPIKDVEPDSGLMAFYRLTQEERNRGRATYQSDLAAIGFAMDTGHYAGYADRVLEIERPQWAQNKDQ